MPFGFFKTRKRSNPKSKSKSKSKKISPRTRKLQRIARTVRTKNDIKIITEIQNKYANKFDECPICLKLMISPSLRQELPCGHVFHRRCISKLEAGNRRCPLCRQFFEPEGILRDLRNKMHEAEHSYDILDGRAIAAREIYEEYVVNFVGIPNDEHDESELEELQRLSREATSEAEVAHSRYMAARQAYEDYRNEMYGILGA
jgi:hypothetical protein